MLIENKTGLLLIICGYCAINRNFTPDARLDPNSQEVFEGPPFTPHKIVCHEGPTDKESGEFHVSPGKPVLYWDPRGRNCLVIRYYRDTLPRIG